MTEKIEINRQEYDDLRAAFRALTETTYELALRVEGHAAVPLPLLADVASDAFEEIEGTTYGRVRDDLEAVRRLEARGWGFHRLPKLAGSTNV